MPEWDPENSTLSFPFSLAGCHRSEQLQEALSRRFTLMLGERDTDPKHKIAVRAHW